MRNRKRRGFTIIELLVAAILAGAVVAIVYALYVTYSRTILEQQQRWVEIEQVARATVDRLKNYINAIGRNVNVRDGQPVVVYAAPYELGFNSDLRPDVDSLSSGETVQFYYGYVYSGGSYSSPAETVRIYFPPNPTVDYSLSPLDREMRLEINGSGSSQLSYGVRFDDGTEAFNPDGKRPIPLFTYWGDWDFRPDTADTLWGDSNGDGSLSQDEIVDLLTGQFNANFNGMTDLHGEIVLTVGDCGGSPLYNTEDLDCDGEWDEDEVDMNRNGKLDTDLLLTQLHRIDVNVTVISRTKSTHPKTRGEFKEAREGLSVYPRNLLSGILDTSAGAAPDGPDSITLQADVCGGVHVLFDASNDDGKGEDDIVYYKIMRCNSQILDCSQDENWSTVTVVPAEGKWRYHSGGTSPSYEYFDTDLEPIYTGSGYETTYSLQYRVYAYDVGGQTQDTIPSGTVSVTSPIQEAMAWFSSGYFMWSEGVPCYEFAGSGNEFGGMALMWPALYEVPGDAIEEDEENRVEYWVYRSIPLKDFGTSFSMLTEDQLFDALALDDPLAKLKPLQCEDAGCPSVSGDAEENLLNYSYYKFHHNYWQDWDWYIWRDKFEAMGRTGLDYSVLPQHGRIFRVGDLHYAGERETRQYIYWLRVYDTVTGCLSQPVRFHSTFEKANPRGKSDVYWLGDSQNFWTQTSECGDAEAESRFAPPNWISEIWNMGAGSDNYYDIVDPSLIDISFQDEEGVVYPKFEIRWTPSKSEDGTRCPSGTCVLVDEYYIVREKWEMLPDGTPKNYEGGSRVWIGPIVAAPVYSPNLVFIVRDDEELYGSDKKRHEGSDSEYHIYHYLWPSKDAGTVGVDDDGRVPGEAGDFAPDFANPVCTAPGCYVPDQYKMEWDGDWTDYYYSYFYYVVAAHRHGSGAEVPQADDTLSVGVSAPNRAWWRCGYDTGIWEQFPGSTDAEHTFFYHCDLTDFAVINWAWEEDFPISGDDLLMKLEFRDVTDSLNPGPWHEVKCLPSSVWPVRVSDCGTPSSVDRYCSCNHAPFFGSDYYGVEACSDPADPDCQDRWQPNRKYRYRAVVWREEEGPNPECPIAYYIDEKSPGFPLMQAAIFDNKEPWYVQWEIDYAGMSPPDDPDLCDPDTTWYQEPPPSEVYFFVWREVKTSPTAGWVPDRDNEVEPGYVGWRSGSIEINGGAYVTEVMPFYQDPNTGLPVCACELQPSQGEYLNDLCACDMRLTGIPDSTFWLRDYDPGELQYGWQYQYCTHVIIDHDGDGPDTDWDTWSDLGCVPVRPVFDVLFPVVPTNIDKSAKLGAEPGDPVPDPNNEGYEKPYDFGDTDDFGDQGLNTLVYPPCCVDSESCPQLDSSCETNLCGESDEYGSSGAPYNRFTPFASGAQRASFYDDMKVWMCPAIAVVNEFFPLGILCSSGFWDAGACNSTSWACGVNRLRDILNDSFFSCFFWPDDYMVQNVPPPPPDSGQDCQLTPCHPAQSSCDCWACSLWDSLCEGPLCCVSWLLLCGDCLNCCWNVLTNCWDALYNPPYCYCLSTDCCIFPWAISDDGSGGNRALLALHSQWMEQALQWMSSFFQNDFLNPFDFGEWAGTRYTWSHFGAYANPVLDDPSNPPDCPADSPRNPHEDLQSFVMVWDQRVWDSGNLGGVDINNASYVTSFMLQDINKRLGEYMETPSHYLLVHDFAPSNEMQTKLYFYYGSSGQYTLDYELDVDFELGFEWNLPGIGEGSASWRWDLFVLAFFDWTTRLQGYYPVSWSAEGFGDTYDDDWWRNYLLVCRQADPSDGANNSHVFSFSAPRSYFDSGTKDIERAVLEKSMPSTYSKLHYSSDRKALTLAYNANPNWASYWEVWHPRIEFAGWYVGMWIGFPWELGWDPDTITLWSGNADVLETTQMNDGTGRIGFWIEHDMAARKWLNGNLAPTTAVDNLRVRLYYGECPPMWIVDEYFRSRKGMGGPKGQGQFGGKPLGRGQGVVYTPYSAAIGQQIPLKPRLQDKEIENRLRSLSRTGAARIDVQKIEQMKKRIRQQYTVMKRQLPAEMGFAGMPSAFSVGKMPIMLQRDMNTGAMSYTKLLSPSILKTQFFWTDSTIEKFTRRIKEAKLEGRLPVKNPNDLLALIDFPIHMKVTVVPPELLSPDQSNWLVEELYRKGITPETYDTIVGPRLKDFKPKVLEIDMNKESGRRVNTSMGW